MENIFDDDVDIFSSTTLQNNSKRKTNITEISKSRDVNEFEGKQHFNIFSSNLKKYSLIQSLAIESITKLYV